jgi:hypothetical protein
MKRTIFTAVAIILSMVVFIGADAQVVQNTIPEADSSAKYYRLKGERAGINYFSSVKLKGVQYLAGDSLTFDMYHSADVIYTWMSRWASRYPGLIDLYEVGKSYEGRPIYQMTLTCKKTGKDTDKPAAFFEGGRHSGEVTGSESVLWLARYLLENYGKDSAITHIINTKTIYLKPVNNPDGHNLYLHTAQSNRSTVRPDDSDRDGLLDEDSPEDLDSNGIILTMRWKDEKKGTWIPDPADTTGRIMKRVAAGKGIYLTSSEGFDNDGDGKINEDGIGGLDLHRNYPENWRPAKEETGRGYTQGGAGEYPLSETETRAVVLFLLSHPSIYVVNSMDTSVPMHLRPPSTSASEERMYPEDLKWYKIFDDIGKKLTGYAKAGDVYNDYGSGTPLFGHGPDFGYWSYGAIWYGDEIWNGGKNRDYNGDGKYDQIETLRWDDEENEGQGFFEWKPAKHPNLGDIEIGGFDPKFFSQNPPAKYLETWIKNEAMFNLEMVKSLPELEWEGVEVKKLKSYKADSADYRIIVNFRNNGKLPTALKQAHLVRIVKDDMIVLNFDTTGVEHGTKDYKILNEEKPAPSAERRGGFNDDASAEPKRSYSKNIPYTDGDSISNTIINIRLYKRTELKARAGVVSTRGGILKEKEFIIK